MSMDRTSKISGTLLNFDASSPCIALILTLSDLMALIVSRTILSQVHREATRTTEQEIREGRSKGKIESQESTFNATVTAEI